MKSGVFQPLTGIEQAFCNSALTTWGLISSFYLGFLGLLNELDFTGSRAARNPAAKRVIQQLISKPAEPLDNPEIHQLPSITHKTVRRLHMRSDSYIAKPHREKRTA